MDLLSFTIASCCISTLIFIYFLCHLLLHTVHSYMYIKERERESTMHFNATTVHGRVRASLGSFQLCNFKTKIGSMLSRKCKRGKKEREKNVAFYLGSKSEQPSKRDLKSLFVWLSTTFYFY